MREEIKEMGEFLRDLFCGYIFKEYFRVFNKKCEKEDWNGLIKFLVYPFVFAWSLLLTIFIIPMFTFIIVVYFGMGFGMGGICRRIVKGIVWLDKKLRF